MQEYFEGVKDFAADNTDVPVYYFQYFDKETTANRGDSCKNYFGLATGEGDLKFDI